MLKQEKTLSKYFLKLQEEYQIYSKQTARKKFYEKILFKSSWITITLNTILEIHT